MKVDLRGTHDLGGIIGYSYRIYGRLFTTLFGIALITVPMELLITVLQRRSADAAQPAISLLALPAALVTLIATAAIIVAVHDFTGGTRPEAGRSMDAALQRFWPLLSSALLAGVLAALALLAVPFLTIHWLVWRNSTIDGERNWWLVLIPGALTIYLAVRWVVVPQAVMLESRQRWAALDSSAAAVRGRWWRTFGILLAIMAVQVGPLLLASAANYAPPLIAGGVTSIVSALVLPFAVTAQTLLYYDLKARTHAAARADRITPAEQDVSG